jgi:hypothetical protein
MIDRIFKNWKTSAIGIFFILGGFVLLAMQIIEVADYLLLLGGGMVPLFFKDPKQWKSE